MALNNTQEYILNSVYEAIRKVLVSEGLLPDIETGNYPNTVEGNAAWDNALKAITADKKFAIEPFNHSSPQAKGTKQVPRMVIIPRRFLPGDLGNPVSPTTVQNPDNPDNYDLVKRPLKSTELTFDVHLISNTSQQDYALHSILFQALPTMGYIPTYDTQQLFFLEQTTAYDLPDPAEGLIERTYGYTVKDLYIEPDRVLQSNIVPIKEITVEFWLSRSTSPGDMNVSNGDYEKEDVIIIDLSHIQYSN